MKRPWLSPRARWHAAHALPAGVLAIENLHTDEPLGVLGQQRGVAWPVRGIGLQAMEGDEEGRAIGKSPRATKAAIGVLLNLDMTKLIGFAGTVVSQAQGRSQGDPLLGVRRASQGFRGANTRGASPSIAGVR